MAIENRLPKGRKAQAVQALGPLSHSKGGSECRLHHNSKQLVVVAPVGAETTTGAKITTAEAAMTSTPLWAFRLWISRGDSQVTCHNCRIDGKKAGKRPDGMQRYRCGQCGK